MVGAEVDQMSFAANGAESVPVRAVRIGTGLSCCCRGIVGELGARRVEPKELAGALVLTGGGRAEEPVTADFLKALRKDVLEKARDEGKDGESEAPGLVSARADIAEGDATKIEGLDAVVGDCDAMGIAGEILGSVLTVAGVLEVDVPGFAEDGGVDVLQELLAVEGFADFGAKDRGQCVARYEKASMGWFAPGFALVGQSTGGGEKVDVRVVGEVA